MEEAATLCDTVALLNDGKIIESGEPKEVCRKYNHQRKITLHLSDGRDLELPCGEKSTDTIYDLFYFQL